MTEPGVTGDDPGAADQDSLALGAGFDDHKAPGAFRTIGEVTRALGIRQHVLRYWEEQFPMLRPVKRSGNRRLYRPEDVQLIETIDRLVHHQGYTLRGARLALEAQTAIAGAAPPVDAGLETDAEPLLVELRTIRATLAAALES